MQTPKKISWLEIKQKVSEVNPVLHEAICKIPDAKRPPFYLAEYEYGDDVFQQSTDKYPDSTILVLSGILEIFLEFPNRTVPFRVVRPGELFNWSEVCTEFQGIMGMSIGSRSIFLLPKIADYISHQRLEKELMIEVGRPNGEFDHWEIFHKIYQHSSQKKKWETTLIYFSKEWQKILPDVFFHQCSKERRIQQAYLALDVVLSAIQNKKNIKPDPYYDTIVHHILLVGNNLLPGFIPAINNNLAPVDLIQRVYTDIYQIQQAPLIMIPGLLNDNLHVFLSSHQPSALILPLLLNYRDQASSIGQILKVKDRWQLYEELLSKKLTSKFCVEFYSSNSEIKNLIDEMLKKDPRFNPNLLDAPKSQFLKGCIKISIK